MSLLQGSVEQAGPQNDHRAQLLHHLDSASLSRFHLKATITAGMGFFTDAYDLFIIGTVLLLISKDPTIGKGSIFGPTFAANSALIGSSSLVAAFIGALAFGALADRLGRKAIYGIELIIMAIGAILSAVAPTLTWLIIVRFLLGIGIGGDYPVSATIISEHSNRRDRGKLVSTVFSMQAAGLVTGYVAALVILGLGVAPDVAWRLLLGLGAVPALATFWLRRQVPESPRFLLDVKRDVVAAQQAASHAGVVVAPAAEAQPASGATLGKRLRGMWVILTSPRYLLLLLGTAGAWFLLDYAYYGNTISSPVIINGILGKATPFETTLVGFLILVIAAVPGYIAAMLLMDTLGRKRIQLLGFAVMALSFGALALEPALRASLPAFAIVFGVSYFFTEFGPNTTTFVYPVEVFPTAARTSGHGISAGVGKIGAFVGVFLFPILLAQHGGKDLALALGAAAVAAVLGFVLTLFTLPETKQRSLEEVSELGRTALYPSESPLVA
jgi:PHS family inorganic phosphate transporter-like MFS transporter